MEEVAQQPQPTNVDVKDERELPKTLQRMVQKSNDQLNKLQQELMGEIQESALEFMQIMGLNPNEGWRLDIENNRFVKVESGGPPPAPPESSEES